MFQKLEGDQIEALKKRFSGQQVFDNYDIQGFMQGFSQFLNNKIKEIDDEKKESTMPDRPQPCQTAIMNRKLYYGFICVSETCRENEECSNYV